MDVIQMQPQQQPHQLNPNAPIYIPVSSYPTVEDYSAEWWDLVHSSPIFRDYWLHDFSSPAPVDEINDDIDPLDLPDFDAFFDTYLPKEEEVEVEEVKRDREMVKVGATKWSKPCAEVPRSFEKAPKIVKNNVRVNPRTIHQPR